MKILNIFINQYFWLGIILILALLVRLYKIDAPIADWHSWRQADTASVTRNFIKEGLKPFLPKYDDMSGVSEHPLANPNRFRFVEFPIYNLAVYPLYLFFGVSELYHRLVSVLFSLGSLIFVYLISKKYLKIFGAYLSAIIFALMPFNVFFSRTTLPEPTFVFFALGMVYFVDRWIWESKGIWGIWGYIFTAAAFLIKPWAIFFIPPLIYSIYRKNEKIMSSKKYIVFFALAVLPFLLWRLWILQQPEGIPASSWLLNGDGIRLRPAFWWWIVSQRLGGEILGATGLVLFSIGLITKPLKGPGGYFLHIWILSLFLYFVIFATGNVRHNYYQIIFVPTASIFMAKGFLELVKSNSSLIPRIWTIPLALAFLVLSFYFGWKVVGGFYQINNPVIIEAGRKADQILPKEAIVVAPYNGDSAFLYQTNRPGWAVVALPLPELVSDYGVTAYVSVSQDAKTKWVMRHFKILEENKNYMIADLTKITGKFDDMDPEP